MKELDSGRRRALSSIGLAIAGVAGLARGQSVPRSGGTEPPKRKAPAMGSKEAKPDYADARRLAQAWMRVAPERLLWGTNWPHPIDPPDHKPDDAALLDLFDGWIANPSQRARIFVENPARLFDF